MSSPLRWGICTAGAIAHEFTSSLLDHYVNHSLVAIGSRSLDRSQKFATKFKIPTAYGSYEELAKDQNVDVVYIGAINTEHHKLCKLFMNHKKNILCEKPLALSLRETRDIIQTAKENDVFLMEAMWTRFFPGSTKIRDIIASGKLGDVKSILVNTGITMPDRDRFIKRACGGGALYCMGVYMVQLTTMIYGQEPSSTYTHGFLNQDGVDESYTTVMKFPSNAMATLSCTYKVDYPNDADIIGTKGRLRILKHHWAPTDLIWTTPDGDLIESFHYPLPKPSESGNYTTKELLCGLLYEADAVKQAIDEGKKEHALMSWKETELISSIMEKARQDLGIEWVHEGV